MFGIKLTVTEDTIRDIVGMANMPLLMFDSYWLALFPKELKSPRILRLERRIVDLVKKEARIRERMRVLTERKQQSIARIQSLTVEAFTYKKKSAILEMKKCRHAILKANAFFLLANHHLILVENDIQKTNRDLLEEAIKACYTLMSEAKVRMDFLEPKLAELRDVTKKVTKELNETEARHENTYRLLHKLVGPDMLDHLDKQGGVKERGLLQRLTGR